MAVVRIRVNGLDAAKARLAGITSRLHDHSAVMRVEAQLFETMIRKDVFAKEQAPDGTPWRPLADSTEERRRNKNKSRIKILQDTRTMFQSIFARGQGNSMVFGASDVDEKTLTHQFGAEDGRVPARPFLPVTPDSEVAFTGGPGLAWYRRLEERLARYILTGRL